MGRSCLPWLEVCLQTKPSLVSLGPRGFERSPSQDAYVPCELHAKPRSDLGGNQLSGSFEKLSDGAVVSFTRV